MDKSTKKLQIGLWSIVAALVVGFDQVKLEKKSRDRRICRHEGRQGFGRSGRKRNAVRRAENHEGV